MLELLNQLNELVLSTLDTDDALFALLCLCGLLTTSVWYRLASDRRSDDLYQNPSRLRR